LNELRFSGKPCIPLLEKNALSNLSVDHYQKFTNFDVTFCLLRKTSDCGLLAPCKNFLKCFSQKNFVRLTNFSNKKKILSQKLVCFHEKVSP